MRIESDYIRWVAEKLRQGLGVSSTSKELEVMANLIVFINSFIPLRGWNMRHIHQTEILNLLVGVCMMKLEEVRAATSDGVRRKIGKAS